MKRATIHRNEVAAVRQCKGLARRREAAFCLVGLGVLAAVEGAVAQCVPENAVFDKIPSGSRFGRNNNHYGEAVAIHGMYAAAGRPDGGHDRRGGSVHVYYRENGKWTQAHKNTLPTSGLVQIDDKFGSAVGVYGNRVIVGARGDDDRGSNSGSGYIFEGRPWVLMAKLYASDAAPSQSFGGAVDLYGDTAVFAARGADTDAGAVYVFDYDGGTWQESERLTASVRGPGYRFGDAVALSNHTLAVTATAEPPEGALYIFERRDGIWEEVFKDSSPFGRSTRWAGVAVDGDVCVLGAPDMRATVIYTRIERQWQRTGTLTDASRSQFGQSVDVSGDTLVVGSSGLVAYYQPVADTWTRVGDLSPFNGGRSVGFSVGVHLDSVISGNPFEDRRRGNDDVGAVYLYNLNCAQHLDCEDIDRIPASCTDGVLRVRPKLTNRQHSGERLIINVNGVDHEVRIRRDHARLTLEGVEGPQTITLAHPPGCEQPQTVDCL